VWKLGEILQTIEQSKIFRDFFDSERSKASQKRTKQARARTRGSFYTATTHLRHPRRLETVAPQAAGLSRGRWNNIRSLIGKALALARPVLPGRRAPPLLPEWEVLLAPLARNRAASLLALARHLSVIGVWPRGVTLADLEAYHEAIVNDRLRAKPEQTWDTISSSWNASRREVPDWPDVEIPRVLRREIYVLPWSDFPPPSKPRSTRFSFDCRVPT
jgi:hypothetical protein